MVKSFVDSLDWSKKDGEYVRLIDKFVKRIKSSGIDVTESVRST